MKLNGTFSPATLSLKFTEVKKVASLIEELSEDYELLTKFVETIVSQQPTIQFAWDERSPYHSTHLFENVTELIIIGYSFPFYNKETDREIFTELLSRSRAITITIVDLNPEVIKEKIENFRTDLQGVASVRYILSKNLDEYPIPDSIRYAD